MLPVLRLAALRRLPAARSISQQIPQSPSLTTPSAAYAQSLLSSRIPTLSARWASTGKRKNVKNILTFKKNADSASTSQTSNTQEPSSDSTEPVEPTQFSKPNASSKSSKPLPDLRYGIPSTFEAEYMKGSDQTGESVSRSLDITDAEAENERPRSSGGAGGEIPKSAYESSIDKRRNKMAKYFFMSAVLITVGGVVWLGRDWENEAEERRFPQAPSGFSPGLFYNRIRARLGDQMGYYTEPTFPKLLPSVDNQMMPPYTLVFSLEDFLVHSEWTREHGWRTAKRPGCDFFLLYLSQYYELCLFTSVSMGIADPVVRKLDPYHLIMWPLFREATRYEGGDYVKDLSYLNRPIEKTILLDTKAGHAKAQPENAVILPPWKGDPEDRGLLALVPFLEYIAIMGVDDVRTTLASFRGKDIPTEFAKREAAMRQKFAVEIEEAQKRQKKKKGWSLGGAVSSITKSGGPQPGEQPSLIEAMAEGKTLFDVMRDEGMKRYRIMQKEIKENGARWLKEEEDLLKKMEAEQMKHVKKNPLAIFGLGPQAPPIDPQQMMAEAARELAAEKEKSKDVHVQEVLSK